MQQFIFNYKDKEKNWYNQKVALLMTIDNATSDFVVKIEDFKDSTPKALRAYWRLIGIVTDYINSTSPDYKWSKEEISDNFKEQVGHAIRVPQIIFGDSTDDITIRNGDKTKPKSISRKSGCTYEEMNRLIEKVLQFGSDIPDCVLTPAEDMEFKKYYGVK